MSVELPTAIAQEQALTRQNVALAGIKQTADAEKKIADVLEKTLTTVQASNERGSRINITA